MNSTLSEKPQAESGQSPEPAADEAAEAATDQAEDSSTHFRGTVQRITYRDLNSGFGILKIEPDAGMHDPTSPLGGIATLVGRIPPSLGAGSSIHARGRWQTHHRFGRQFRAQSVTESDPTGEDGIVRYLASGEIRGFGPVLAERVVAAFGEATIRIIDETPHRLLEVQGIGEKKLDEILRSWKEKRAPREVMLFFQNHHVPLSLAHRIYRAYGERAIEVVSANPYLLAREVWGIGFLTADRVAEALGVERSSPERLIAGLSYALEQSAEDGHCYLLREELLSAAAKLLEVEDQPLLEAALAEAALRGDVLADDDRMYLPPLYLAEQQLARAIAARIGAGPPEKAVPPDVLRKTLESPQLRLDAASAHEGAAPQVIQLSDQQQHAITLAVAGSLTVITGGPGCGKTTVLRAIAGLFRRAGLDVKLAAPTGRAAQRLSEVCDMPASTIHRLLKFDPIQRTFVHSQHDPLELDVLIVDESSMIDVPLAAALMAAVSPGARVIIVGDSDQLPSVGPGLFLFDLLNVPEVPRVRLTSLFRRANESLITHIAHQINAGEVPAIPQPDGTTKTDAYFLPARDAAEAASLVERLATDQLPKKFGLLPGEITVLTPMNQGELGVIALNQRLQSRLVPKVEGAPWVRLGALELRIGDRVCQRVNNYNIHPNGVFNGDQGEVIGIDQEKRSVWVRLWDGREIEYPSEMLSQLDLAYALTIHRSQGSEVNAVVLVLHDSHHIMLERQLIYTGVTRAKRLLVVVGSQKALATAARRTRSRRRNSVLSEKIRALL